MGKGGVNGEVESRARPRRLSSLLRRAQIFENDRRLLFELHRQQLIELIRSGDVPASLVYAHDKLAPLVEQNPDFLPDLEEVMSERFRASGHRVQRAGTRVSNIVMLLASAMALSDSPYAAWIMLPS